LAQAVSLNSCLFCLETHQIVRLEGGGGVQETAGDRFV
jgi:hypothetical protein